jgi:hypothetical protein
LSQQGKFLAARKLRQFAPAHGVAAFDDSGTLKVGFAFPIRGENTIRQPGENSVGKTGAQVLFHYRAADAS